MGGTAEEANDFVLDIVRMLPDDLTGDVETMSPNIVRETGNAFQLATREHLPLGFKERVQLSEPEGFVLLRQPHVYIVDNFEILIHGFNILPEMPDKALQLPEMHPRIFGIVPALNVCADFLSLKPSEQGRGKFLVFFARFCLCDDSMEFPTD
jgi:hypothetical protein